MSAKVILVSIETLRAGAHFLGIVDIKPTNSAATIERMIGRELAKDLTYGDFGCGVCGRDVTATVPVCPFCMTQFKYASEVIIEEGDKLTRPITPDSWEDDDLEEVSWSNGLDERLKEEQKARRELLKEMEKPKPKPRSRTSKKVMDAVKESERERKREIIRRELPYTKDDLEQMKRPVLAMVGGVLGIKNPLHLGKNNAIIDEILKVQVDKGLNK
jgi:hypothetical protein